MHINGNSRPGSTEPTPDEVRGELRRILDSPDFYASDRNRRLLQYVVERSLRGERVKAYQIGTQVFGRPASFDATKDPIVRIEVSKIRRDLEIYYLKSGKHRRVRIMLPKGRYLASFVRLDEHLPATATSSRHLLLLRTALLGLRGADREAQQAWVSIQQEFPGFQFNPQTQKALETICGADGRIRELLLEGLQRAADAPEGTSTGGFSTARQNQVTAAPERV